MKHTSGNNRYRFRKDELDDNVGPLWVGIPEDDINIFDPMASTAWTVTRAKQGGETRYDVDVKPAPIVTEGDSNNRIDKILESAANSAMDPGRAGGDMAGSINRFDSSNKPSYYRVFERHLKEPSAEFVGILVASDDRDCLYQDWRGHLHFTWDATVEGGEFTTIIHCECWYCGTDLNDLWANAEDWIAWVCEGQPPPILRDRRAEQ